MLTHHGFIYFFRRDKFYRPICVVNVAKIKAMSAEEVDNIVPAVNFLMTYVFTKVTIPGKAETSISIIDLNGVGMTSLPIGALRKFLSSA